MILVQSIIVIVMVIIIMAIIVMNFIMHLLQVLVWLTWLFILLGFELGSYLEFHII